jgi:hydroxybutyrate-dimer hydrolase
MRYKVTIKENHLMDQIGDVPQSAVLNPAVKPPAFLVGPLSKRYYSPRLGDDPSLSDDLLTAGCGASGLQKGTVPNIKDPDNPTAAELRKLAIFTNYRAIIDTAEGGGYGVLFGPAVAPNGTASLGEGMIAGWEYISAAEDDRPKDDQGPAGNKPHRITLMVQIPESFDPQSPKIVTAPASGSRGIYGAIGAVGEWALKRGCAVAYCDKGTGVGLHNLQSDTVTLIDGRQAPSGSEGISMFTALAGDDLEQYRDIRPGRFAYKHAHSQVHPEQAWGRYVEMAIDFALYVLNAQDALKLPDGSKYSPENTIIIASGISNGGGASLRAAEQFGPGKIWGVVVSEPNVNPEPDRSISIQQGEGRPLVDHSRSFLDYTTLINVYQACASLSEKKANGSSERCAALGELGLLRSTTQNDQIREAQTEINNYGILPDQNHVQAATWPVTVPLANAVTFTHSYARIRVDDPVSGYSFGLVDASGEVVTLSDKPEDKAQAELIAKAFGVSNGIPPDGGTHIQIINDCSVGGPRENSKSISASSNKPDQNLDGALRLRSLYLGKVAVTHEPLRGRDLEVHQTICQSIETVRASGSLHGIPTIIVHGRNDSVIAPNHASRPYYALALKRGGPVAAANVRYYEVMNAHHFDAFNGLFEGFCEKYVPLHWYFAQALDILLAHLTDKAQGKEPRLLPSSQVIRTNPRSKDDSGKVIAINAENASQFVPRISEAPAANLQITFADNVLRIPEPKSSRFYRSRIPGQ